MASQIATVNSLRGEMHGVLHDIESAQARAAKISQEWTALGGEAFLSGFDFDGQDITQAQFVSAIASCGSLLPDILSTHKTNLYRMKG